MQNRSDVASRDTCIGGRIAYSIAVDSPLTVAFRTASLRLRTCRWCSAHVGHCVWPWIAGAAAVPAPAGLFGPLALFLGIAPVVFPTLGIPFPGLIVLLVALVLVVHRPYRCSLRGAIAAKLVRAAIWLRRTAGYGYLVCPGLW